MKIAFTTKGINWESEMDPRFGRTEYFLVYDDETDQMEHYDNREAANEAHGAGPKAAKNLFDLKPDVLITGNGPGGNASAVFEKTGIKIFVGAGEMNVKEAYSAYKEGELKPFNE